MVQCYIKYGNIAQLHKEILAFIFFNLRRISFKNGMSWHNMTMIELEMLIFG